MYGKIEVIGRWILLLDCPINFASSSFSIYLSIYVIFFKTLLYLYDTSFLLICLVMFSITKCCILVLFICLVLSFKKHSLFVGYWCFAFVSFFSFPSCALKNSQWLRFLLYMLFHLKSSTLGFRQRSLWQKIWPDILGCLFWFKKNFF